ncbi:MAG: hypothetical protein H6709_10370 [Kofleriaceae bacterium]|nr:hypothetical protein [Kofleriaceae bacterium]
MIRVQPRDERAAKRWQKIQDRVLDHKWKDAEKELDKLLREDPGDAAALQLREQVRARRAVEGDRGGGDGDRDD